MTWSRREFMGLTASALCGAALAQGAGGDMTAAEFNAHQAKRREELWSLLGDLAARREPKAELLRTEQRDGYSLEHLVLDLNGVEPVPALLLIPDNLRGPSPGMMYIHWHGGDYAAGKTELLNGTRAMQAYAPVYAEKGIVALAIDSWCFGERMPYPDNGGQGESDTFKEMLWKGQVLWGMMMFDE